MAIAKQLTVTLENRPGALAELCTELAKVAVNIEAIQASDTKPIGPVRAELVGRYAVQIFWNDGHSTGIYTFDYLRSLCSCAECIATRENVTTE